MPCGGGLQFLWARAESPGCRNGLVTGHGGCRECRDQHRTAVGLAASRNTVGVVIFLFFSFFYITLPWPFFSLLGFFFHTPASSSPTSLLAQLRKGKAFGLLVLDCSLIIIIIITSHGDMDKLRNHRSHY